MSTTSDPAGEITYTPTTHRISKAKKGKKVHVCEYPGCGKIFTRAEHRNSVPPLYTEIDTTQTPRSKPQPRARISLPL
ncbi:MAG: hypothetical protein L6R40_006868 [Gallowayella cf. fulva]|nr:MAG: hypothetical protein L6R40_006868 [Xanthomendoza cf. fulva]